MTIKTIRKPVRSIGNPSLSSGVPTLSSVGTLFLDMASTHTNLLPTTALSPAATPTRARRAHHLALLLIALSTAAAALTACQQPLFDARDPRSQYDRADAARNTRPEQFVMDEYGNRRPNIRGRLIGNQ